MASYNSIDGAKDVMTSEIMRIRLQYATDFGGKGVLTDLPIFIFIHFMLIKLRRENVWV